MRRNTATSEKIEKYPAISAAEPQDPVLFTYDGSAEGIMTCVFYSYAHRIIPIDIQRKDLVQSRLDQAIIDVQTQIDQALRVRKGILRCGGKEVWKKSLYTASADDPRAAYACFIFLRELFDHTAAACKHCKKKMTCTKPCPRNRGPHILDEWSNPHVRDALRIARSVTIEINRMHELMRFSHLASDIWFAKCNPNADVVPFLMNWFTPRFNTQKFLIWDEVHHVAGLSENGMAHVVKVDDIDALISQVPSKEEAAMEDAWQRFYHAVAIDERYHPELRGHFMPMRLWKNITEMQDD